MRRDAKNYDDEDRSDARIDARLALSAFVRRGRIFVL